MNKIVFFDTEVTVESKRLYDIGAVSDSGSELHTTNRSKFTSFVGDSRYLCGHNIIRHDLKYVHDDIAMSGSEHVFIDTLFLSPLLFPCRPYHKLLKDDKLQVEELNNPLHDAMKAKALFLDELSAFNSLPEELKIIYSSLLGEIPEFSGFFDYVSFQKFGNTPVLINEFFKGRICENAAISNMVTLKPVELAYCLALINVGDKYSIIPPWVSISFPETNSVLNSLCNTPCKEGCSYCNTSMNIHSKLKKFYGFDSFRKYNGEPLQENAVKAAVSGKSLLAIFPTGGGKSLTFQLPALIAGEAAHGLTVVISPLQSLMKDQVDNLEEKGIIDAVTINGLLNPIERADAIKRVANGLASILYISPESLRSASIEKLLLSRNVVRFVIDEAHCFSAWGQDFRVDYMYIGDFIKNLCEKKQLSEPIPVSCFTATAKQKVILDITDYFRDKLGIHLDKFSTDAVRENLHYEVIFKENDEEKYTTLRNLIHAKNCPTIVYVSRTTSTYHLAERLTSDGFPALPYNGKMERNEKIANQNAFMQGDTNIIVATTAFGMGVDKDNVGLVIHFDISDSLENYVQEAGRAGRKQTLRADCYVLFKDDDLDKHFSLLSQSKLSFSEIQQVWKAVKDLSGKRGRFTKTPLEIARAAGWDESMFDAETRVKTAIATLENAGYVKRGKNVPRIYATGILAHSMMEAAEAIETHPWPSEKIKQMVTRIAKFLFSRRSDAKGMNDEFESRIDYIADRLGAPSEFVVDSVNQMREAGILGDSEDMSAHLDKTNTQMRSLSVLKRISALEDYLIDALTDERPVYLKELSDAAIRSGLKITVNDIQKVLMYWQTSQYIRKQVLNARDVIKIDRLVTAETLRPLFERRRYISGFIIQYLYNKIGSGCTDTEVPFSVLELKEAYNNQDLIGSEQYKADYDDIKNSLLYLSKIEAMDLDGGFLVLYHAMQVERLVTDNKIKFKKTDYQRLNDFYAQRIQQIHIVGEYAHLMVKSYDMAMEFVSDYFRLDYTGFQKKYFKGTREGEINRAITPEKYNKLFGELSVMQRRIIDDAVSKYIVVAAGPGSGKTKVLVHKLASLMMLEDVRSEQLLMLTFSRSAATEFKKRLIDLIGEAAYFVEIKTFHSYCFDLLGQIGNLEETSNVVSRATDMIENGDVDIGRITKTVLVIDEAQDMDANEFALVKALMARNEEMRIIAVGDDDQNIYEFRGSNSRYLRAFVTDYSAVQYELTENFRSYGSVVELANTFAKTIRQRMKTRPIVSMHTEIGVSVITKFASPNLEIPTLDIIKDTYECGKICVLTSTNEDALRMTGILNKNGFHARLIQSNDDFNLFNLLELRTFVQMLGDAHSLPSILQDRWNETVAKFSKRFRYSTCLQECLALLNAFDSVNSSKYYTDVVEYIRESKYEDFLPNDKDTVLVSTIHKSKGREFDSVYILLNQYSIKDDEHRRALYVGMTRAKKELYVNCNTSIFDSIRTPNIVVRQDEEEYPEPDEVMLQLSFKDIVLDYCRERPGIISKLHSGSELFINGDYLEAVIGNTRTGIVKLSKAASATVRTLQSKGYSIYKSEIRFIVYWKKKDAVDDEESLVVLPNMYLKKNIEGIYFGN